MLLESRFLRNCFSNIICKESSFAHTFMVKTDHMINIKKMRHHESELREPKFNCITLITDMLRLHTC